MSEKKSSANLTKALLILYFIVLTWIILFKMATRVSEIPQLRGINLIPYGASAVINDAVDFKEIIYNMIAFVPLGIYISMLKKDWSFIKKLTPIFLLSLSYEIIQYIFSLGASDITDLINNTLGGAAGIAGYMLLRKILKGKTDKIINIIASSATVLLLLLIALLLFVNS